MKSIHYNKTIGAGLFRALIIVLGERPYATDKDRAEALDELREFRAWLGKTDAGHGLTSESAAAFLAREQAGVTAKMSGNAVVIRVRRA